VLIGHVCALHPHSTHKLHRSTTSGSRECRECAGLSGLRESSIKSPRTRGHCGPPVSGTGETMWTHGFSNGTRRHTHLNRTSLGSRAPGRTDATSTAVALWSWRAHGSARIRDVSRKGRTRNGGRSCPLAPTTGKTCADGNNVCGMVGHGVTVWLVRVASE
jgi:hypothetical protein